MFWAKGNKMSGGVDAFAERLRIFAVNFKSLIVLKLENVLIKFFAKYFMII